MIYITVFIGTAAVDYLLYKWYTRIELFTNRDKMNLFKEIKPSMTNL